MDAHERRSHLLLNLDLALRVAPRRQNVKNGHDRGWLAFSWSRRCSLALPHSEHFH